MRSKQRLSALAFALGIGGTGGCGSAYEAGSFDDYGRATEPRMRSVGCLDVRLQPRGEGEVGRAWVAIDYELGNRCRRPIDVDLRAVAVWGEAGRGMSPMDLYDPREEVVVATLDGETYASEALAYEPGDGAQEEIQRVCVDVTRLHGGARGDVPPVCFHRVGDALRVEARP